VPYLNPEIYPAGEQRKNKDMACCPRGAGHQKQEAQQGPAILEKPEHSSLKSLFRPARKTDSAQSIKLQN